MSRLAREGLAVVEGRAVGLRIFLVVSMVGLWFLTSPASGHACSCGRLGTPQEALAEAELVFRGTVTSIGQGDEERNVAVQSDVAMQLDVAVQFDVRTVWKGLELSTVTLSTPSNSAACGIAFEQGVEYVVYVYEGNRVGLCTRTARVEFAAEDLAAFASGVQTGTEPNFPNSGNGGLATDESPEDRTAALVVVALVGTLTLGFAAFRLYVRRQADTIDNATNVDQT